jgi:hypothetical protein
VGQKPTPFFMAHWRAIPGYESRYEVSDIGEVRSLIKNRLLRPGRKPSGHLSVALGRSNSQDVHVLVLLAFRGPRPPKAVGRHRNYQPDDNRLSNLEWSTYRQNALDKKYNPQRRSSATCKLSAQDVREIKRMLVDHSGAHVARLFNISQTVVSGIRVGRRHIDV